MGEGDACGKAVLKVLEETLHGVGRAGEQEVVEDLDVGIERGIGHVGLTVLGVVEGEAVDVGLLAPDTGTFGFDEGVHFFTDTDEVLAFGVGEELEELGDGDRNAVVARTSMRIFGLVLGVLGGTEFVLVGLLLLALDGVLLVDRREQEVERFADKGLT